MKKFIVGALLFIGLVSQSQASIKINDLTPKNERLQFEPITVWGGEMNDISIETTGNKLIKISLEPTEPKDLKVLTCVANTWYKTEMENVIRKTDKGFEITLLAEKSDKQGITIEKTEMGSQTSFNVFVEVNEIPNSLVMVNKLLKNISLTMGN
ncbi:MAG: hypothetical protein HRT87_08130 [Legionellales bacterium]|nr:hypothetical protein [Legionellales bacterium]